MLDVGCARIIPYDPDHLFDLAIQDGQSYLKEFIKHGYAESLHIPGYSFTAVSGNCVYAVWGLQVQWPGRGILWAILSKNITTQMFMTAHRVACRMIREWRDQGYFRLEASADVNFEQGNRWLKLLGFEFEGVARKYTPDGRDVNMYALVT